MCVSVCDLETSKVRSPRPQLGCSARDKNYKPSVKHTMGISERVPCRISERTDAALRAVWRGPLMALRKLGFIINQTTNSAEHSPS